jgi:integrase
MRKAAPSEAKLADIFSRYWQDHGQNVASKSSIRVHLRIALEMIDGDPFVSEFGHDAQEALMARFRTRYAQGAAKRTFASVKAAIVWAWRREMITAHPPFIADIPDGEPRERTLSIAELARLWDAAEQPHAQAFIIGMLATLGRPAAVLELTRFRCDLKRGIIDLNPEGRERTKKRRPVIPMADALRPWVTRSDGHLVEYRGKPVRKINAVFRNVRDAAGLGADVVPYSLRHTMATELAGRGVPELEISAMLGHVMPNNRTSARYVKYRPDFMAASRQAVDEVINEIGRAATRPMIPETFAFNLRSNGLSAGPGKPLI